MTKKVVSFLYSVCALCVLAIAFSVFFQILARMVFHVPASWSVEIGRAMFAAIVFLGTPCLIIEDSQMCIDIIKSSIKNVKVYKIFCILEDIICYFVEITLAWGCFNRVQAEWHTSIPTVEWMTYGYIYLVMFIGSLFMLYASVAHTRDYIKKESI